MPSLFERDYSIIIETVNNDWLEEEGVIMEPVTWLIIMVVLIVVEVMTLGLSTIWFAFGALVSFIASLFGASVAVQIVLFLVVSIISLILTRPIAMKYLNKGKIKTNTESLIGKHAVVATQINNLEETGQVKVNGLDWTARAKSEEQIIEKDSIVEIIRIDGVKLIVEKKGENV